MGWKLIKDAPRDGTVLMLARVGITHIEFNGRWGFHSPSGAERWVDGNGLGLFEPTHFDFRPEPPRPHENNDHQDDGA